MEGKILMILMCITALCCVPAAALNIAEGPVLIQTTELPVHSLSTDGRYVVMSGSWENATMKEYPRKEGFESDGGVLIYDSSTGKIAEVPGGIPPVFAGKTTITDGVIFWTSAYYRFPVDSGNMRQETALYQYTIGDPWPKHSAAQPGRINMEDKGRVLTVTGADNHPEDTKFTVFDTKTKTTTEIPLSLHPSPGSGWITGDYVLWNELWREGDGKIHVYNLATKETSVIGGEGTYLTILDVKENMVLYRQSRSSDYRQGPFELRATDLKTGKTVVITDKMVNSAEIDPPIVIWTEAEPAGTTYALYAKSLEEEGTLKITDHPGRAALGGNLVVWDTWDHTTGTTDISAVRLDSPGKTAGVQQPTTEMRQPAPAETTAGMPSQYIIGTLAFALACVLAILWRK